MKEDIVAELNKTFDILDKLKKKNNDAKSEKYIKWLKDVTDEKKKVIPNLIMTVLLKFAETKETTGMKRIIPCLKYLLILK